MTGGIIQLAAYGLENNALNQNPQITFFKTIFRRYTNFDKIELNQSFSSTLTFGREAECKIRKMGDLLSSVLLTIELPEINMTYLPLTNIQTKLLLADYGIPWTYPPENEKNVITYPQFEYLVGIITTVSGKLVRLSDGLINETIDALTKKIEQSSQFINIVNIIANEYNENNNTNVEEFIDELILKMIEHIHEEYAGEMDDYYTQYFYLYSYKYDIPILTHLPHQSKNAASQSVFYDPSVGLPFGYGVEYLCTNNAFDWQIGHIYQIVDFVYGPVFFDDTLKIGNIFSITGGYANISINMINGLLGEIKIIKGIVNPNEGIPGNPEIGDVYASVGTNAGQLPAPLVIWENNYYYQWSGTGWMSEQITLQNRVVYSIGTGYSFPQFDKNVIYLDFDFMEWTIFMPPIIAMSYDPSVSNWRKNIKNIFNPITEAFPPVPPFFPGDIGLRYLCVESGYGYIKNVIYAWDGAKWNAVHPDVGYTVAVEEGTKFGGKIIVYDGFKWNIAVLDVPLYDASMFRKIMITTLQNVMFESNTKLYYAIENCNTTVIPSMETMRMRDFFDSIVINEIDAMPVESMAYKLIYDIEFDESIVGSQAHVLEIQNSLATKIKDGFQLFPSRGKYSSDLDAYINVCLKLVDDTPAPYYFYFKPIPGPGGIFDTSLPFVNCPRVYQSNLVSVLRNQLALYVLWRALSSVRTDTQFGQRTISITEDYLGKSDVSEGYMYDNNFSNGDVNSMFNNFFTIGDYDGALEYINVDANGTSYGQPGYTTSDFKMFNLHYCIAWLNDVVVPMLRNDLNKLFLNFSDYDGDAVAKKAYWSFWMQDFNSPTNLPIIDYENPAYDPNFWTSPLDGLAHQIDTTPPSQDRLISFMFNRYHEYIVSKSSVGNYNYVPYFAPIIRLNPIKHMSTHFAENLCRIISHFGQYLSAPNVTLNSAELARIETKIRHITNAYTDAGIRNFADFHANRTNADPNVVPELFPLDPGRMAFDGITSLTCFLLENSKSSYMNYTSFFTDELFYDSVGEPLIKMNKLFKDNYIYDINITFATIIQANTEATRCTYSIFLYESIKKIYKLKNAYLSPKFTFDYPLGVYIELLKIAIDNPNTYLDMSYSNLHDFALHFINDELLPFLQIYNNANAIYTGPMDLLISSSIERIHPYLTNPYNVINDPYKYGWYQTYIKFNILQNEENFDPINIGIIQLFLSAIQSPTNPFASGTQLHNWYDKLSGSVGQEIDKMNYLLGLPYDPFVSSNNANAINPINLYNDIGNIRLKYNGFAHLVDFINYLLDHIIKLSPLGDITQLYKSTIEATSSSIIAYYENIITTSLDTIKKINPYTKTSANGSVRYSTLEDNIRRIYEGNDVNFAWVSEVGHYLIDSIKLFIGDQLIDQMNGEYLHIIHHTEGTAGQMRGYDRMIGNVSELTTFNANKKNQYLLQIPLKFSFCKFYSLALPLISLIHTDVSIRVKLKNLEDVAYWTPNTLFIKKPKLNCNMVATFIILDHDERLRVGVSRSEQLIEVTTFNGHLELENINNSVTIPVVFSGMSKEIFIVCTLKSNIDGSALNGEKKYINHLVNGLEPFAKIQIKLNGCERETPKDGLFYMCINRLTHHTASQYDGIYVYSFALYPELLQPSGAANLSKFNKMEFIFTVNDEIVNQLRAQKDAMKIGIYSKSYNILRIMSGMAGLAYYH